MTDGDNRQLARNSLFILAELRLAGRDEDHRVKVRNLSSGGMMAEGDVRVERGTLVWVNLRNVGWVEGAVAWVHANRFGVAFTQAVDPLAVRAPVTGPQDEFSTTLARRFSALPQPERPRGPARKVI